MIRPAILASFFKEANIAKAQDLVRATTGGAEADKASADRVVQGGVPKVPGIGHYVGDGHSHQGAPGAGSKASTHLSAPPPPMQAREQGRRAIALEVAGLGKSKAKTQRAVEEAGKARQNMTLGRAGTVAGDRGGIAGVTGLRRRLGSKTALPVQQPKLAALSKAEKKRKSHSYYVENRERILRKKQVYRVRNKPQIAKQQRQYRREIKYGRKKRRRISTGGHGAMYGGYS